MARHCLGLAMSGWTNVAIAAALEDATGISHRHLRKDKLLDSVKDLCKDAQSHERICRAALGGRTAVEVRQILRYWYGAAGSRMNKTQCIDAFLQCEKERGGGASASHTLGHSSTASASHIETPGLSSTESTASASHVGALGHMSTASALASCSSTSTTTSTSAPTVEKSAQLALVPFVKASKFMKRAYRRWVRHDLSSKIKAELKAGSWKGVLIRDIRRIVSQKVGADLETGRRRQFFERRLMMRLQLMRHKRRYKTCASRQAETGVGADAWPPQALREHAPMQYEDYLSRRAWRAPRPS